MKTNNLLKKYKFNSISVLGNSLIQRIYYFRFSNASCFYKRNFSSDNSNIKPIVYSSPSEQKTQIFLENKKKCGIYLWTNLITGKSYVGSGVPLSRRLYSYFSEKYLNAQLKRGKSAIYSSILKYGLSNFKLEILEYCEASDAISREQFYINKLKPEYNLLDKAGSRLGFKHLGEAIAKIKLAYLNRTEEHKAKMEAHLLFLHASNIGRKHPHTEETKKLIGEASLKMWQTKEHREKIISTFGTKILITNIETNETIEYASIREAAREMKENHVTLGKYLKNSQIFKGKYLIKKK
uniref:GIY-YIG domain-containing protein n=1 Tax=Dactylella tenuis TaxID=383872 RepID=A0A4Y5MZM3_9PEZI|nr:hypothetical protein [Dactylella tenuis]QCW06870.1 hypothetical protein [Dactylella tenuis]